VRRLFPVLLAGTTGAAPLAPVHPIHTTLTEIARDAKGTITLRLRVFADDFSAAASRHAGTQPSVHHVVSDAVASRYVADVVRLDDDGKIVRLSLVRQRREGDVVWLELRGTASSMAGLRLLNAMLFELHADQINVVQVHASGATRTLLFAKGDRAKGLER
jgi:hypothetical protein